MDPSVWGFERAEGTRAALAGVRADADALIASFSGAETAVQSAVRSLRGGMPEPAEVTELGHFSALYARLCPLYEAMATALRDAGQSVHHLHPTNLTRSLAHVAAGVGIAVLYEAVLPSWALPWAALAWCAWAWGLEGLRRAVPTVNTWCMWFFGPVAREHERYRVNSATWYGTSTLILSLTAAGPGGVLGLLALAFGDPVAGLVGRRFGRIRLVRGRSLEGALAFVVAAFVAEIVYLRWLHPEITVGIALALALITAVVGALVELVCKWVDDNLAIPVIAGWVATIVWRLAV